MSKDNKPTVFDSNNDEDIILVELIADDDDTDSAPDAYDEEYIDEYDEEYDDDDGDEYDEEDEDEYYDEDDDEYYDEEDEDEYYDEDDEEYDEEYDEDEYDEYDEYYDDDDEYDQRHGNGIRIVDERDDRGYRNDRGYRSDNGYRRPAKKGSTAFSLANIDFSAVVDKVKGWLAAFVDWLRNLSRGKKIALAVVLSVLLLVIILSSWACSYLNRVLDGFDYAHDDEPYTVSFSDFVGEEDELIEGVSYADLDAEELMASINEVTVDDDNLFHQEGTTNILLLGTDNREVGGHARSDAIILLSVNRNTKQLVMTSFLRDTAVAFNGASYSDKLTHGYAYGKGPLMVKTIQSHFGIKIDYYMAIDFFAFIDVVDYLGGINLDVTESERKVMNNYIREINRLTGKSEENGFLYDSGKDIKVTGKQALGFARNRYSSNEGDFGRTNRQRIILSKIIDKLKSDPTKALGLLEEIAPRVKTDYTKDELMSEVMNILDYVSYDIVTGHIPADDTWHYGRHNGMSLVVCDFKPNRNILIKSIYGVDRDEVLSENKDNQ